jgi:hypothetical protein
MTDLELTRISQLWLSVIDAVAPEAGSLQAEVRLPRWLPASCRAPRRGPLLNHPSRLPETPVYVGPNGARIGKHRSPHAPVQAS